MDARTELESKPVLDRQDPTELQLAAAADTFAMLASPARLHLVSLMITGRFDVGSLAAKVGLSLPTISQHLSKLRLAGIVSAHRKGRHSFYTVEDPHVLSLVEQIFEHIAPDGTLAPDPPMPATARPAAPPAPRPAAPPPESSLPVPSDKDSRA